MSQHMIFRGKDLGVFDPDDVTMEQAMRLEDATGFTLVDLQAAASKLSGRATQALVWFMRIQAGETDAPLHDNFKFKDISSKEVDDEDPTEAADPVAELEKAFVKSGTPTSGS